METKEQKIERLKEEIKDYKNFRKSLGKQACIGQSLLDFHSKKIKELEQQLKELEKEVEFERARTLFAEAYKMPKRILFGEEK